MKLCPECNGARGFYSDSGPAPRWEVCSDCDGAGEWDDDDTQRSIDKAHAMSTAWDRAFAALSKRDTPGFNAAMAEFRIAKELS